MSFVWLAFFNSELIPCMAKKQFSFCLSSLPSPSFFFAEIPWFLPRWKTGKEKKATEGKKKFKQIKYSKSNVRFQCLVIIGIKKAESLISAFSLVQNLSGILKSCLITSFDRYFFAVTEGPVRFAAFPETVTQTSGKRNPSTCLVDFISNKTSPSVFFNAR